LEGQHVVGEEMIILGVVECGGRGGGRPVGKSRLRGGGPIHKGGKRGGKLLEGGEGGFLALEGGGNA